MKCPLQFKRISVCDGTNALSCVWNLNLFFPKNKIKWCVFVCVICDVRMVMLDETTRKCTKQCNFCCLLFSSRFFSRRVCYLVDVSLGTRTLCPIVGWIWIFYCIFYFWLANDGSSGVCDGPVDDRNKNMFLIFIQFDVCSRNVYNRSYARIQLLVLCSVRTAHNISLIHRAQA